MTRITAKLTTGMVVQLSNGRHEWGADEPLGAGGTDTGPDPYELLLGSLAACTCVTISAYCLHKGLTLESVSTTYDFSRIHADDCRDCDIPERVSSNKSPAMFISRAISTQHSENASPRSPNVARSTRPWRVASSLRTMRRSDRSGRLPCARRGSHH